MKRIMVGNFPLDLKAKAMEDAAERSSNLNAVLLEILAASYGLAIEPANADRATTLDPEKPAVLLRIPEELDAAVTEAAWQNRRSKPAEVVHVVAEHYGMQLASAAA